MFLHPSAVKAPHPRALGRPRSWRWWPLAAAPRPRPPPPPPPWGGSRAARTALRHSHELFPPRVSLSAATAPVPSSCFDLLPPQPAPPPRRRPGAAPGRQGRCRNGWRWRRRGAARRIGVVMGSGTVRGTHTLLGWQRRKEGSGRGEPVGRSKGSRRLPELSLILQPPFPAFPRPTDLNVGPQPGHGLAQLQHSQQLSVAQVRAARVALRAAEGAAGLAHHEARALHAELHGQLRGGGRAGPRRARRPMGSGGTGDVKGRAVRSGHAWNGGGAAGLAAAAAPPHLSRMRHPLIRVHGPTKGHDTLCELTFHALLVVVQRVHGPTRRCDGCAVDSTERCGARSSSNSNPTPHADSPGHAAPAMRRELSPPNHAALLRARRPLASKVYLRTTGRLHGYDGCSRQWAIVWYMAKKSPKAAAHGGPIQPGCPSGPAALRTHLVAIGGWAQPWRLEGLEVGAVEPARLRRRLPQKWEI
jgi:hypothetical protein